MPSPRPSPEPVLVQQTVPCYERAGDSLCKQVHRWTHSDWLAQSSDWLIAKPARIAAIALVAFVLKSLVHRGVRRVCQRAANGNGTGLLHRTHLTRQESTLVHERRQQRAATISSVLQSIATGVIYTIALIMSLSELTFNIGPLIASASIIGVAVGFGAQTLVKDFLSGIFMILEDQYGVGDRVDLGTAKGVVEAVGLRVTRLRDLDGTVWYMRNGEIVRVGNQSQGWSRVMIDIDVAHREDIDRVRDILVEAGERLVAGEMGEAILEAPEVWGVQALTQDAMVMRVGVKTKPAARRQVGTAFRELIAAALAANEVEIGGRAQVLLVRPDESGDSPGSPAPSPNSNPAQLGSMSK